MIRTQHSYRDLNRLTNHFNLSKGRMKFTSMLSARACGAFCRQSQLGEMEDLGIRQEMTVGVCQTKESKGTVGTSLGQVIF